MKTSVSRLALVAASALLLTGIPRAHAASKEIIQLQTQVQQIMDTLNQFQQGNAERIGVLQHLIEQTADSVNKMSQTVSSLDQTVRAQNEATGTKVDGVSGQIQALNDSVDELKTRMANLNKTLQDMQAQQQNLTAQQAQQPGGLAPGGAPGGSAAGGAAVPPGDNSAVPGNQAPAAPQAPPVKDLYQGGIRDYNAARYDVANSEFSDLLHYYPEDNLAGNAQFYLGEIAYRQGNYQAAIKAYNTTIEQYAGNPKIPAAQLRKGEALLALNQRDAGIRELRSLIQRFPQTPEAQQARSRLNGLGVRINPTPKPTAAQR